MTDTDIQVEQTPKRSFGQRLASAFQRLAHRWADQLSRGIDARRGEIHIPGRVFDTAWYLAKNPDVAGYDGAMVQHFFLHGLDEGRPARFFDARWYYAHHRDLPLSRLDAWTHYCTNGIAENRAARFIYVTGGVERPVNRDYRAWIEQFDALSDTKVQNLHGLSVVLDLKSAFSLILTLNDNDPPVLVRRVLLALKDQIYERLECFVSLPSGLTALAVEVLDDDPRFTLVEREDAVAHKALLALCTSPYVAFVRASDILDPAALLWAAYELYQTPAAAVIYADEDRMDDKEDRSDPYFKPQFNYELFLAHNMLGNFTMFRRDLIEAVGGVNAAAGEDFVYDLALKVYEREGGKAFHHIPRVLNHVRGPVARRAPAPAIVSQHLTRLGKAAEVMPSPEVAGYNRVRYALPKRLPKVSIIIPTRDRSELLSFCLGSLLEKTTYTNYEVIIVDNGSVEPETFAYFDSLKGNKKVRVLRDDRPFNFSELNNGGVAIAKGTYVCLMNNDIEMITPDWLEEMLSFAQQPDVGCVGVRLWYPNDTLQHAGVLIGFFDVAGHMHKHIKRGETGYANRAAVHQSLSAVTAAVLLVRKSVYNKVGGLDEGLAVAFNDVDFCLKVRDAGYRNVYTPHAEMYHHESASRGAEDSPEKRAREQREIDTIKSRYGLSMRQCPAFSPNLSLTSEDMSFAFPPRVPTVEDLLIDLRKRGIDVPDAVPDDAAEDVGDAAKAAETPLRAASLKKPKL